MSDSDRRHLFEKPTGGNWEAVVITFNTNDHRGVSPLHSLANKPTAFRSGTHLSLIDKIIYHCILVQDVYCPPVDDKNSKNQTLTNLLRVLWSKINVHTESSRTLKHQHMDASQDQQYIDAAENLEEGRGSIHNRVGEPIDDERRERWRQHVELRLPPNYDTCFNLGILFLGPGPSYINKIEQKKEKNIWSAKVMDKLLKQAKEYRCDETGKNPHYTERTMPYDIEESEGETQVWNVNFSPKRAGRGNYQKMVGWQESSEEGPSCIHETQQKHGHNSTGNEKETQVPDIDFSPKRDGGGNSLKNRGWQKSYKEDPNSSLLLRLGKTGLCAEPIIVAGQAAKELDDELLLETKMKTEEMGRLETLILIAAKNGIKEMVEKILDLYPLAIHDIDPNKKNIVLLAVENRHPHVYELLMKRNILKDSVFGAVDNDGNSASHLAAMFVDYRPWLTPEATLQMQWEVKWYKYVKKSMLPNFFRFHDNENESAKQIFTREHKGLVQNGGQWLNSTATSCSVVAILIATVAFATSTTVPGGTKEWSEKPNP